ncbi:SCO family protein [Achromobacter spanius]|uniref:SCO family protein n=1 Tax=Achromobacter spanius TaxID=217203 RepID=UPI003D3343E1
MPMLLVFLCSLAPIVAAFVVYMNPQWWPADSSNYGTLVNPQRPMPQAAELRLTTLDGKPFDLQSLKGKWLLVAADGAACPESCARKLFITRNSHASQGKNVDRLARVWFITDDAAVPEKVLEAYKGTVMVRVDPDQLARFLLARDTAAGQPGLQDPIWVIDPLGNLMMQYPAEADGVKVRKDISKLVYNSRIG